MQIDKKILIDDFSKKDFLDKKKYLLEVISKINDGSKLVNDLGTLVYELNDETKGNILIEVYDIVIDAVNKTNENKLIDSVNDLQKAKDYLVEMKKQEEYERNNENGDDILNQII